MRKVARLAYVEFETPDIDRLVEYYTKVMGLRLMEHAPDVAFLSATIDHHTVALRRGAAPKCTRFGMQLSEALDMNGFAASLTSLGLAHETRHDVRPGIAELISLSDPEGLMIDVFAEHVPQPLPSTRNGINPVKLGHVASNVRDLHKTIQFYEQALGMVISDWIGDFFAFMRCGPDHHTVNFVQGPKAKMHHVAFELMDFAAIKDSSDLLGLAKKEIIWGPVRHGPGHNIATYHRNPDEQIVELFCELDRVVDDRLGWFEPRPTHEHFPQMPMVWNDIKAANALWGGQPPASFLV
jgi:catechol 2,3-dioxygenase-like lactoylglutathione lyase family enzyme